jgi:hypothetical protein
MKRSVLLLFFAFVLGACSTQHPSPSQYRKQEQCEIKALSPEEVADLLAGKGMGFAKAAELNGYPGPAHVLEFAAPLRLSSEQRARTEALFERMNLQARQLGAQLVQAERELDASFREHRVTAELLTQQLEQVAALQAKVRNAHLHAHLEQTQILSAEQIAKYIGLRGYSKHHAEHGAHK